MNGIYPEFQLKSKFKIIVKVLEESTSIRLLNMIILGKLYIKSSWFYLSIYLYLHYTYYQIWGWRASVPKIIEEKRKEKNSILCLLALHWSEAKFSTPHCPSYQGLAARYKIRVLEFPRKASKAPPHPLKKSKNPPCTSVILRSLLALLTPVIPLHSRISFTLLIYFFA